MTSAALVDYNARWTVRLLWLAAFIACIFGANWALSTFGIVPVGFGLAAPAGVYFVGLSFTARDLLHEAAGRWWVLVAVVVGAALSALVNPHFALASGLTFLAAEGADFAVYDRLRRRGWMPAVIASNIVGLVLDSVLFLWMAFGNLQFIEGQIFGKAVMTALAVAVLWMWKRSRRAVPVGF